MKMTRKPIYLDYASTTPVDPAVFEAMLPYFGVKNLEPKTHHLTPALFGNPGSLHSFGQQASAAVFVARQEIAKALGCHYNEIIFTGSATEANNLAIRGAVKKFLISNFQFLKGKKPRIIISSIEHESVMTTAKDLEKEGVEVVVIPVSQDGIVDLRKLQAALSSETVLVSVMYANNEVGTVQPIAEIARIVEDFRVRNVGVDRFDGVDEAKQSNKRSDPTIQTPPAHHYPLLHTDAVQAFQYLSCDVQTLGVDLLTISAHKIYGPKGIGCLYARLFDSNLKPKTYNLQPVLTGGGQEFGLRSGTENVPAIVGFAKAVSMAGQRREREAVRIEKLRTQLWQGIRVIFPKARLNGGSQKRLPNNLNIYIPGIPGEQLLVSLDLQGVAVSSGSACAARSIDPSHVILALSGDEVRAKNSIRMTLGRFTTAQDIRRVLSVLRQVKEGLD